MVLCRLYPEIDGAIQIMAAAAAAASPPQHRPQTSAVLQALYVHYSVYRYLEHHISVLFVQGVFSAAFFAFTRTFRIFVHVYTLSILFMQFY